MNQATFNFAPKGKRADFAGRVVVKAPDVTAPAVRHAIEGQTFTPKRGAAGVHLVDSVAARFGEFDHAHLVGGSA